MSVSQYPLVLAERLDENGYAALVEMADDRESRLTGAMDQRFTALEHRMDQQFAAVDQRFAAFEHRMDQQFAAVDQRFAALEHRMDQRFTAVDQRFVVVDQQFAALTRRLDQQFAAVDQRMAVFDQKLETHAEKSERRLVDECGRFRVELGGLRTEMVQQRADLMKWAMVFWISQAAAVAGIVSVLR